MLTPGNFTPFVVEPAENGIIVTVSDGVAPRTMDHMYKDMARVPTTYVFNTLEDFFSWVSGCAGSSEEEGVFIEGREKEGDEYVGVDAE